MIVEYHRPDTIEEALKLLGRAEPRTLPLAGGSALNQPSLEPVAAVDLQALGLDMIERQGNSLSIGATATLEQLLSWAECPAALQVSIRHEASFNLRQVASVAGTLVAADGRSPFTTVLLALDAGLTLLPEDEIVSLGNLLTVRSERLRGKLITVVSIPLNVRLAYQHVARTPADLPIVCAALAQWPSGRTRLALGGYGQAPTLALDGPEASGGEAAARNAYLQAEDEWASAEYRAEIAGVLARRCLEELQF
jgi:CO/xanthine dehydrogenase FAD-binding subunit